MKLMRINRLVALTALVAISLSSCKKDNKDEPTTSTPNEVATGTLNLGNNKTADFFGEIKDENGQPISGVSISVGNKTATTDAKGIFFIENATVKEDLAYIKAEKEGYFLGSRSLIPDENAINNVKIQMLKMDLSATVLAGGTVTVVQDGASVDLEGDYVDASGNVYNGLVNVYMKLMPGAASETQEQMPGMLYAQNESGNAGVLATYGMLAVELRGAGGEELQIAKGSTATIHVPVSSSQLSNAPASIALWHFDEVAGYWVEEGSANLVNGEYVGEVDHFSFWNCDDFLDDCQIVGSVVDGSGNPLPYSSVTIYTNTLTTTGITNSNGGFNSYIPANQAVTFEVTDLCGNVVLTQVEGPFSTGSVNNVTFTATTLSNAVQVTGNVNDCSLNPISNGMAEVVIGVSSYYFPISNGVVNLSVMTCSLPASVDITVTDFSTYQQGTMSNVPVVSGTANFGTINACSSVSEYVSWNVDGNLTSYLLNLYCADSNGIMSVYASQGFDYVGIDGSVTSAGTYSLVQDPWSTIGFSFYEANSPQIAYVISPAVTVQVVNYPTNVGDYLDLTIIGTYYDQGSTAHTINVDVHVKRDA